VLCCGVPQTLAAFDTPPPDGTSFVESNAAGAAAAGSAADAESGAAAAAAAAAEEQRKRVHPLRQRSNPSRALDPPGANLPKARVNGCAKSMGCCSICYNHPMVYDHAPEGVW
jgi:hypothetical protein